MALAITKVSANQIYAVVEARRSLPIPSILGANVLARDFMFKQPDGYKGMNKATNDATRAIRDAGISEPATTITFQVCSEEYTMAEAVKDRISQEHYDLLTFAFRSVLDPESVPIELRQRLARSKPPDRPLIPPAERPQEAPAAPKAKARHTVAAKPKPAAKASVEAKGKKFKVSQSQMDEMKEFMED